MKLEDQVCSLESAKQLKELNFKQESLFYWRESYGYGEPRIKLGEYKNGTPVRFEDGKKFIDYYSAYTVAELGEMMPAIINIDSYCGNFHCAKMPSGEWHPSYQGNKTYFIKGNDKNESEARAKMLIYLAENDLINVRRLTDGE